MPAHHERQAVVRAARAALDGHERTVHVALPQLIGTADATELLNAHGIALNERKQRLKGLCAESVKEKDMKKRKNKYLKLRI